MGQQHSILLFLILPGNWSRWSVSMKCYSFTIHIYFLWTESLHMYFQPHQRVNRILIAVLLRMLVQQHLHEHRRHPQTGTPRTPVQHQKMLHWHRLDLTWIPANPGDTNRRWRLGSDVGRISEARGRNEEESTWTICQSPSDSGHTSNDRKMLNHW